MESKACFVDEETSQLIGSWLNLSSPYPAVVVLFSSFHPSSPPWSVSVSAQVLGVVRGLVRIHALFVACPDY